MNDNQVEVVVRHDAAGDLDRPCSVPVGAVQLVIQDEQVGLMKMISQQLFVAFAAAPVMNIDQEGTFAKTFDDFLYLAWILKPKLRGLGNFTALHNDTLCIKDLGIGRIIVIDDQNRSYRSDEGLFD